MKPRMEAKLKAADDERRAWPEMQRNILGMSYDRMEGRK